MVAIGRLAGGGLAIAVVAVAVNLSDVTSFAEHAEDTFASEGGASTAYLGHLLRPIPLDQIAGVWFSRDYREPVPPGDATENTLVAVVIVLLARGRHRSGAASGEGQPDYSCSFQWRSVAAALAPAALTVRRREAAGGAVSGRRADGRDRRVRSCWPERLRWLQFVAGLALTVMVAGLLVVGQPRVQGGDARSPRSPGRHERRCGQCGGRWRVAGERVGGVRQVLHARHQSQRRIRGRVSSAGGDAQAASDLRPLLRPRRADLPYVQTLSGHHQATLAVGEPTAGNFKLSYGTSTTRSGDAGRGLGDQAPSPPTTPLRHRPPGVRPRSGRWPKARPGVGSTAASRPEIALFDPLDAGLRPRGWARTSTRRARRDSGYTGKDAVQPGAERVAVFVSGSRQLRSTDGRARRRRKLGDADEINYTRAVGARGDAELSPGSTAST